MPSRFGFPDNVFKDTRKSFICAVVRLHRIIAIGAEPELNDKHLGNWLYQFSLHLKKCKEEDRSDPFEFKPESNYGGRSTTYQELTAWVLNPKFLQDIGKQHVSLWNEFFQALIDYSLDKRPGYWEKVIATRQLATEFVL